MLLVAFPFILISSSVIMIALWNYLHQYYVCSNLICRNFLLLLVNKVLQLMATMIPLIV